MKLMQVRLLANDFEKSVAFYRDVLEFPVGMVVEEMGYAYFKIGETNIEVVSRSLFAEVVGEEGKSLEAGHPSSFFLCFSVEDVDAAYERLSAKGVEFINKPQDKKEWDARVAHFRDLDGNVLEIYKHPL